jgi:DNA segregation ATPase FtsK/SpoIIIE, S-DNA-T family
MIYGVISYFRSLLFIGFFCGALFILDIKLFSKNYKDELDFLYFILTLSFIFITIFYIRYWKYILMPYSINFHSQFSHNTLIEVRNKRTLFLDYFIYKKSIKSKNVLEEIFMKDLKRFELEYANLVSINLEIYRQNKEKILHYLGLISKDYEVNISPKKNKSIVLSFYKLPNFYEIDYSLFQKDLLFLGIYEKGFYYRDINTLDHHLVVGESGSGKSNLMQLFNINFLHNLNRFNKMYMIDLKGGVELKQYERINNIEFVSNIEKLDSLLDNVLKELESTQKFMLENNLRKLDTYTLLIFDEIGAVSVYPDKKIKESIFNKLSLIAMQGRASGILLFLFGQKIDSTILPTTITNNIQSRVLLKTSNDNNINIIDLKDNIRERISTKEIQDFTKGRVIIKNGFTSDKNLLQIPFVSDNFLNTILKIYSKKL